MTTAALYARYSSELQNERSIEDQLRLCEGYALAKGLSVVARYDDRAISGTKWSERLGLQRLLRDGKAGRFTHLIVEHADRLSRHPADIHTLREQLNFAGVTILQVTAGELDSVQASVSGLVSTVFLKGLADKTRRGLAGVVAQGRSAGGRAYGYRPVKGEPGRLEIVAEEAAIIRRIFADYSSGKAPHAIAAALNAEGHHPPRGLKWNASTLHGSLQRGNGLLFNELYAGIIVWNKVRMVRDPETRRRISRANPKSEWQRREAPELAIIDRETFDKVAARRQRPRGPAHRHRKHLLSGLLQCPCCGGGLQVKDRDHGRLRLQCGVRRETGTCNNRQVYYADRIEQGVLQAFTTALDDEAKLRFFVKAYNEELNELTRGERDRRGQAERKLARVELDLNRIVDLLMAGTVSETTMAPRIRALEAEKRALEAELAEATQHQPVRLFTGAVDIFRGIVRQAAQAVRPPGVAEAFRALLQKIVVQSDYRLLITGNLVPLVGGSVGSEGVTHAFTPVTKVPFLLEIAA